MLVYQADARIWLGEESRHEQRPVTLGSLPASSLDAIADRGFRWLWLRGVWETDNAAREAATRCANWLEELKCALPDLELRDIDGPPFAVTAHRVRGEMGGDDALEALRSDLARRDIRLLLDFVSASAFADGQGSGPLGAILSDMGKVAAMADGICAVRTSAGHGRVPLDRELWRSAIPRIRSVHPRIVFVCDAGAEPESALEAEGFDHALDTDLLDSLASLDVAAVRAHLERTASAGGRLVRFLERHGGRRAAAEFPQAAYFAAAVVVYAAAGVKLVHDGQIEGRRAPHDVRLSRRASESPDGEVMAFHERLLEIVELLEAAGGTEVLRSVRDAWEGNVTSRQFIAFLARGSSGTALLVAVNYGPVQAQCYVDLSSLEPRGREWIFQDLFSTSVYERDGNDLAARGLYLDLPAWDYNVFEARAGRPLEV